ncbi:MAG: GNAT family N-acetyltransferase [Gammaproteobacteria bacterium]|nr:GNAT family N-acetyltransferase [Gammaproteobacteria bacterium]
MGQPKTKTAMVIRKADTDDLPSLIRLGREMHQEAPTFNTLDFDEQTLVALFNSPGMVEYGACFIAEDKGETIGMFCGLVIPHFFGHSLMANDLCLFVTKSRRGGTAAYRLIKTFESWAIAKGAVSLRFGISTNVEPERTLKLYEKLGYKLEGYQVNKYYNKGAEK